MAAFPARRTLERLSPAALSVVFALAFCWPLIAHWGLPGVSNDWDQHQLYHWVPYITVHQYAEIPLWNPFACGGMPMLANPQSRWFSPFFLIHLWLGPGHALLVEIVAHIALAWAGMFYLGRIAGLSRPAAIMAAAVFAGSAFWYLHLGAGHTGWLAYAYMPWILALVIKGRWLLGGALLAIAIGEGGTYAVPHTLLLLAALTAYRCVHTRSMQPAIHVVLVAVTAAILAAPKLLPMAELMSRLPRLIDSSEAVSVSAIGTALLSREQILDEEMPGHPYRFLEYGAYVGIIPVALALFGAAFSRRSAGPWLIAAILGVLVSLGATAGGEYSPWALLHGLPLFASQHVPSRFLAPTTLTIAILAGIGLDATRQLVRTGFAAAATIIVIAVSIDLIGVGTHNLGRVFDEPLQDRTPSPQFVQYRDPTPRAMYPLARANMGAVNCYEPLAPEQAAYGRNEPGYRGEQFLTGPGSVKAAAWSPHRLAFDIDVPRPTVLVVNQNYDPSWRLVSPRGRVADSNGLLAVAVPESGRYELAYRSDRFLVGAVVATSGLMACAAAALYRRRRRA